MEKGEECKQRTKGECGPTQSLWVARDEREKEREEEPDADSAGADQLPWDQTQPSEEQQPHNDAENGEPASDPLYGCGMMKLWRYLQRDLEWPGIRGWY
ncbi:unnamed protein product [Boreogadus saida]